MTFKKTQVVSLPASSYLDSQNLLQTLSLKHHKFPGHPHSRSKDIWFPTWFLKPANLTKPTCFRFLEHLQPGSRNLFHNLLREGGKHPPFQLLFGDKTSNYLLQPPTLQKNPQQQFQQFPTKDTPIPPMWETHEIGESVKPWALTSSGFIGTAAFRSIRCSNASRRPIDPAPSSSQVWWEQQQQQQQQKQIERPAYKKHLERTRVEPGIHFKGWHLGWKTLQPTLEQLWCYCLSLHLSSVDAMARWVFHQAQQIWGLVVGQDIDA